MNFAEFSELVNLDVRNATTEEEAAWLRDEPQLARVWKELKRLETTVSSQLEQSQAAVRALPAGSEKRAREEQITAGNETKRLFYRERVRDRIAEIEDLAGGEALVTLGEARLYLDAIVESLDPEDSSRRPRPQDAIKFAEAFLDKIDPPVSDVA